MQQVDMDVKTLFVIVTVVLNVCCAGQGYVAFNFHEKLAMATTTTTTTERTDVSQVIRVPELDCPLGQRRDRLGNCRQRL